MTGWMIVMIGIALSLYALKLANKPLKALLTGQDPPEYCSATASSDAGRDRRLCACADLLAVPGTLVESAARLLYSAVACVLRYLGQQFVTSVKALFAPPE